MIGQADPEPPPGPGVREEAETRHQAPGGLGETRHQAPGGMGTTRLQASGGLGGLSRGQGERLQAPVPAIK